MIFFDIDGTLIDSKTAMKKGVINLYLESGFEKVTSLAEFENAWNELTDRYFREFLDGRLTFNEQRIKRIEEIYKYFEIPLMAEDAGEKFEQFLRKYENSLCEFDDVKETLEKLKEWRMGIISNGDQEQQLMKLRKAGILEYFEIIVTAGECGFAKPKKEIFEIAIGKANVEMKDCFYVGDEFEADIVGSNNAGMTGILIDRNSKHPDDCCEYVIRDLSKMVEIMKEAHGR